MRITFVVPRYGLEVLGGAEYAARMLAERLASSGGHSVRALTSCAADTQTWANDYEPGTVDINGVEVSRFRTDRLRDPDFDRWSYIFFATKHFASRAEQEDWFRRQGPESAALLDAVAADDADAIVFYPYLYGPTVFGLPRVAERAILHPAAHDELPLRLPILQQVFRLARGLVFQTESERRLVQARFPVGATPQVTLGLGIEPSEGEPDAALAAVGLDDRPFLLCLGRVDDGKGAQVLREFFAAYKERRPGPLRLVFAGPVVHPPEPHADVVLTGAIDEPTKWGLLRGATALVNPSPNEAFSLVLMEAWTAGVPVLVNGRCEPMREHCLRSGGGLWFEGYGSFEVTVDRLVGDTGLRRALAAAGHAYATELFAWPALLARYERFLEECVGRR